MARFTWTKELLIESARRFRTRTQWQNGDNKAYHACHRRGWIDLPEITGHMDKGVKRVLGTPRVRWTKELLIESARRFSTRGEWKVGDPNAYSACHQRGLMEDCDITGHMPRVFVAWDKRGLVASARQFDTRTEWKLGDPKAYTACYRRGLLDDPDITGHMEGRSVTKTKFIPDSVIRIW